MPTEIGFVLFPNLTQLDLMGPLQVLSRLPGGRVHVAARTLDPVPTDCGVALVPTVTYAECPALDVLCVPGGGVGVADAIADGETVPFVRRQAQGARFVTSVCTGALILGAAGLLRGRNATTHWNYVELLPLVGARHQPRRVVRDGNVITAAGVASGIDFALHMIAELDGAETAQTIQLGIEYDPQPPFATGHPDRAPEPVLTRASIRNEPARAAMRKVLNSAMSAPPA